MKFKFNEIGVDLKKMKDYKKEIVKSKNFLKKINKDTYLPVFIRKRAINISNSQNDLVLLLNEQLIQASAGAGVYTEDPVQ